ncbi:uncharacterized protein LOC113217516 [Frankliniella occidentalis]|uniref:Uncharacterized protein LOC113217516 n=1 Tax=Frankliniella occidentalis TaxID=133901 RepID=A0A6J1TRB2_FRAOC|nr:uncharacterized protein LOC113217516 [Frankliniella occidentalis]
MGKKLQFVRRLFRRGRSADTGGGHAGRDNDDRDSADTWTTSGTSTSLSPSSIGAGETFGNIALKNSSGVYLGSSTHTHFHGPVTQVVARSRLPPVVQGRAHDQQALLPPAATQDQQHLHDAQRPGQQPELHATVALDLWNELCCVSTAVEVIILLFSIMFVVTMHVTLGPSSSEEEYTATTTATAVWTPNAPNEDYNSTATQSAIPSSHPRSDSDLSLNCLFLLLICFYLWGQNTGNQYFLTISGTEYRALQHAEYMGHNGFHRRGGQPRNNQIANNRNRRPAFQNYDWQY